MKLVLNIRPIPDQGLNISAPSYKKAHTSPFCSEFYQYINISRRAHRTPFIFPCFAMSPPESNDHWTHQAYSASASFVPQLTSKVVAWLNPEASDIILDLGCGDGPLTAKIKDRCASVVGYDASGNLIDAARKAHGSTPNISFDVQDCRYLENSPELEAEKYTKVFSNAALHWILRDPTTRHSVLRAAFKALQPGGVFVFEMGGAGNVAEVHAALLAAIVHQGLSIETARDASPWFFPSEQTMTAMLEQAGFEVENCELEYRPTKLTAEQEGGLEGWVRLMGAHFLDALQSEEQKEAAVAEVGDVLKTVIGHDDGSMWLGYVRLRMLARKK